MNETRYLSWRRLPITSWVRKISPRRGLRNQRISCHMRSWSVPERTQAMQLKGEDLVVLDHELRGGTHGCHPFSGCENQKDSQVVDQSQLQARCPLAVGCGLYDTLIIRIAQRPCSPRGRVASPSWWLAGLGSEWPVTPGRSRPEWPWWHAS